MAVPGRLRPWLLVGWVAVLALCFAQVEIQIEGAAGWAANLPTWRIEQHWLLDIFWGGRPMTGYHAWVFPFIALAFHLPIFMTGEWSWRIEARIIAAVLFFWVLEDLLWFVMNPAFGLSKLSAVHIPWHKNWWGPFPVDYWVSSAVGGVLMAWSYARVASSANRDFKRL